MGLDNLRLPAGLRDHLICPACSAKLADDAAASRFVCGGCDRTYPVLADGTPVLVHNLHGVLDPDDIVAGADVMARTRTSWKNRVLGALPSNSSNRTAAPVLADIAQRLCAEITGRRPRLLIVGTGDGGHATGQLLANPRLDIVRSDVVVRPNVDAVIDGHAIPFADATFDAVIAQAVFEHVLEPPRCVAECRRVLADGGLIYVETPFLQQVHGGAFDFTRYTALGHRRLLRDFVQIRHDVVAGPGTTLAWTWEYFWLSQCRRSSTRAIARILARLTSFWLHHLDNRTGDTPGAFDTANCLGFYGRVDPAVPPMSDAELIASFPGWAGDAAAVGPAAATAGSSAGRRGHAADPRPTIVMTSDNMWNDIWGTHAYLAEALSHSARVLFVEAPVSVASPLRDRRRIGQLVRRLDVVSEHLAILAPLAVPPQNHPRLQGPNATAVARQIRSALDKLGWDDPDVILCGLPASWRIADAFPSATVAALLVDAPAASDPEDDRDRVGLLAVADVVVGTSPLIVEEATARGLPGYFCPQGVDVDTIAAAAESAEPPELSRIAHPRIAYLGALTTRIDVDLVASLARRRPDWQFVMIGGTRVNVAVSSELPELRDLANVHFIGEKSRPELGRYLGACDVGWIPYSWSPFNKSSNPLKAMEYLAAGLPVVAPGFVALAPLDAAGVVTALDEGAGPDAWEAALAVAVSDDAHADDRVASRNAYAAANSWHSRGAEVAAFLAAHPSP